MADKDVGLHLLGALSATFLAVPKMKSQMLRENVDGLMFSFPQMRFAVGDISVRFDS